MKTVTEDATSWLNKSKDLWDRRGRPLLVSNSSDDPNLLTASTGLMAIATVYLYFIGFLYSYFFFQRFGVSLDSLDLSTPYYLIHSYSALNTARGLFDFALFVSMIYLGVVFKIRRWLLLAVVLSAFPVFFWLSYETAIQDADDFRSHPEIPVKVTLKKQSQDDSAPQGSAAAKDDTHKSIAQLGDEDKLWLLLQTKDKIIVFSQPKSVIFPEQILPARVFTISLSDIEWSATLVQ